MMSEIHYRVDKNTRPKANDYYSWWACNSPPCYGVKTSDCCPYFENDDVPHTVERWSSAYPDAFRCLDSINCGLHARTKWDVADGEWSNTMWKSVVYSDLHNECTSLKCRHRLSCMEQM